MSEKITLIENGKILSNDEEVAECFNEYFINITDGMGIDPSLKEVYENLTSTTTIDLCKTCKVLVSAYSRMNTLITVCLFSQRNHEIKREILHLQE